MIKPHEIYDNTNYIPNKGLRLLDIPMNSSLTFQKLLWFHLTYDCVYTVLIWGAVFNKAMTREYDIITIVTCALKIIWLPIEIARINYGYKGNINETFPELIAFLIFTICFILPLSILPLIQSYPFGHERATIGINLLFIIFEIVVACFVMHRFMQTQSAAFFLRTAPIIDKTFKKRYDGSKDIMSTREIQLGMQRFEKERDAMQPFKESDQFNSKLK